METQKIIVGAVIFAVIMLVVFLLNRSGKKPADTPKATPPKDTKKTSVDEKPKKVKAEKKKAERLEVDAPVEIHDGMSLAEIKRAKAARVKDKKKGRRETAAEVTAQSKSEAQDSEVESTEKDADADGEEDSPAAKSETMEDVSAGWEDLIFDYDDDSEFEDDDADEVSELIAYEVEKVDSEVKADEEVEEAAVSEDDSEVEEIEEPEAERHPLSEIHETSLADGLSKTRTGFIARLSKFFGGDELDEDLLDEVEEVLYTADIGPAAATQILGAIEKELSSNELKDPKAVWAFIREYVEGLLNKRESKLDLDSESPFVILVIGVNGVGKTTTIGKLASKYKAEGRKVMLVAGDTFRAAAVEQLEVWGERTDIPVHTGESEADPASVIFSGVERGKKEGMDVIICDTAGRLHTKAPLLDELRKIGSVAKKVIETAPHETILVLDANTGQNAIQQATIFSEAVPVTGLVLTKLDGTAKGGVILGICEELDAPIRYIGIGEGVNDLREFHANEFVEALFL